MLDAVGVLAVGAIKRRHDGARVCLNLCLIHFDCAVFLDKLGSVFASQLAEHDQVGERITAEAVSSMQTSRHFTRGKQPRNARHLRVTINSHATHHVVRGWSNFHRFGGNVYTGKLLELVVHTGQFALNMRRGIRHLFLDPTDVQVDAAVW